MPYICYYNSKTSVFVDTLKIYPTTKTMYIYIYQKKIRAVILLPIMLGTSWYWQYQINIRYIYYAVRFDCTRQSSSAAISKQTKLSELHWYNFNFSTAFALCNPNGNFNPRGVQVFCIFSMMASQIGSISYPICRFACSVQVRLIFLIFIPSIIEPFPVSLCFCYW